MTTEQAPVGRAEISVSDIGGIDAANIEFEPGITILTGENATNRTSLLTAINAVLGGTLGRVRRGTGRDEGTVTMEIDGTQYGVRVDTNGPVAGKEMNPYTDQSDLVDLYATLIQQNKIRQKFETLTGNTDTDEFRETLGEFLMSPVDTDEIEDEIESVEEQIGKVESNIEDAQDAKESLIELEENRTTLKSDLSDLKDELSDVKDELDEFEDTSDSDDDSELVSRKDDLEEKLSSKERSLNNIEREIETKKETIEENEAKRQEAIDSRNKKEKQLENLNTEYDDLDALRSELREVKSRISSLSTIIDFSNDLITGELMEEVAEVTESGQARCPTCGEDVAEESVRDRLTEIKGIQQDLQNRKDDLEEQIDELETQKDRHSELKRELTSYNSEISKLEEEITDNKRTLKSKKEDKEQIEEEIEEIKDEIEQVSEKIQEEESEEQQELADLQTERNTLQRRINEKEDELSEVNEDIDEAERTAEKLEDYEERLENLKEQKQGLNDRVRQIQQSAADAVEKHMEGLLDRLGYKNIAAVNISPVNSTNATNYKFNFRIAREVDGSALTESSLLTLSESERSLIGIVLGIAGYVTHNVNEEVPFILLDSVEQFDSERINTILNYISSEVDSEYLIAALLPEDADALTGEHQTISADASL